MKVGISFCHFVSFVDKSEFNPAIFGTQCMELELDPTFFGLGSKFVEIWIQLFCDLDPTLLSLGSNSVEGWIQLFSDLDPTF